MPRRHKYQLVNQILEFLITYKIQNFNECVVQFGQQQDWLMNNSPGSISCAQNKILKN